MNNKIYEDRFDDTGFDTGKFFHDLNQINTPQEQMEQIQIEKLSNNHSHHKNISTES